MPFGLSEVSPAAGVAKRVFEKALPFALSMYAVRPEPFGCTQESLVEGRLRQCRQSVFDRLSPNGSEVSRTFRKMTFGNCFLRACRSPVAPNAQQLDQGERRGAIRCDTLNH